MAQELYMVGLVTRDTGKSRQFYKELGLAIAEESEGAPHISVPMGGGLHFFLSTPGVFGVSDSPHLVLEFYFPERAAVDAKYAELIGFGYPSYHEPFVTSFGMYFAMINDPDGHIILLSAD